MTRVAAALLLLATTACAPRARAGRTPAPARSAVDAPAPIDSARLRRDLFAFADDSMRGRSALGPDAARAARFIAAALARAGVEPAGDSGYLQRVPLAREWVGQETRFDVVDSSGASTRVPFGPELVPVLSFGAGAPLPRLDADAPMVFAGFAISGTGCARDDLAGLALAGKTVVFVNDVPASLSPPCRDRVGRLAPLAERLAAVLRRRPAAVIILTARLGPQLALTAKRLTSTELRFASEPDGPRVAPMVLLGALRRGSPLLPASWPSNDHPRSLGRRFVAHVDHHREDYATYNVVGIVRGSDPALRASYVAFGAHLDHLGVRAPQHGDSIANGADDDGSGSMALLAIARAAARAPAHPRRSLLFVWHTAEELGLYGSLWFTEHPTVPLDSVVAMLDADMIGRNAPDSLYLVGPAAAPGGRSRLLGAIVDSVNAASPRPFAIDRRWDSLTDPEQMYFRSDHYNYAAHGVPIVFFTSGLHADYHQVTDEPSRIDYAKLARVTWLIWASGVAVANRVTRPIARAP